ncbi:MAG TPA: hypothetical protein VK463_18135 [Desulfomonilaceae bacterium]|nr:hypothetical protein [Desulfomonilaceae bacterium]
MTPESSRNVNAKEAIEYIRGSVSNSELMERFKISPKGFADLLRQLFEKRLISENDLNRRGIRYKVVKKDEPEFEAVAEEPTPYVAAPEAAAIPEPIHVIATEHPEDFLDTVELTELLSSFGTPPPPTKKEAPPPVASEEKATKEEIAEKKSRFSISGLFKKT